MVKDHAHTTSCSICGEIKMTIRSGDALGQFLKKKKKKKKMENLTDSQTGRLRYIYSTLSIYLARVELVKLSEMLEKAYIPRRSEFGGFLHARDVRAIPT